MKHKAHRPRQVKTAGQSPELISRHRISADEIVQFAEQLRENLQAGRSINASLKMIIEKSNGFCKAFCEMIEEARQLRQKEGCSLATALGRSYFPKLFVMAVAVAEFKTSNETLIKALAEYAEFEKNQLAQENH
ncbi:MAG: type II secretion system F family protein [Parcubacteria group bacterium]